MLEVAHQTLPVDNHTEVSDTFSDILEDVPTLDIPEDADRALLAIAQDEEGSLYAVYEDEPEDILALIAHTLESIA